MPFERGGTKAEGEKNFGNGKLKGELIANFSATMVTQTQTQTQTHLFKQDHRKSLTTYLSCAPVRRE